MQKNINITTVAFFGRGIRRSNKHTHCLPHTRTIINLRRQKNDQIIQETTQPTSNSGSIHARAELQRIGIIP
jgi:hypothetical protein